MIDSREPKNGDFASYVEGLSGHPPGEVPSGMRARKIGRDPMARARPLRGPLAESLRARANSARSRTEASEHQAAGAQPPGAGDPRAGDAARPLDAPGADAPMRTAARIATVAGIVLFGLSLLDDPPYFADPAAGILLLVAGAILRRIARKLQ